MPGSRHAERRRKTPWLSLLAVAEAGARTFLPARTIKTVSDRNPALKVLENNQGCQDLVRGGAPGGKGMRDTPAAFLPEVCAGSSEGPEDKLRAAAGCVGQAVSQGWAIKQNK